MSTPSHRVAVCFVCLGNICRSPAAEGVFLGLLSNAGLRELVRVDSAGTGAWHEGELADERTRQEGARRGMAVPSVARQFTRDDFDRFDLIVAMDKANVAELELLARNDADRAKIDLLRRFDPRSPSDAEVPDPYYGGPDGFSHVFDLCEAASRGLLAHLRTRYRF
jgi:protein-tyrosine phosphatase